MSTPLPLHMTEMDHGRPSIQRPHNGKAAPLLKVEDPSSCKHNMLGESEVDWTDQNCIKVEPKQNGIDHCDVNANKKRHMDRAPSTELRVRIPSATSSEGKSPRGDLSPPVSPAQYANPGYCYNTPTPDSNPVLHPFSPTSINDNDFTSEKSDLIVRDDDRKGGGGGNFDKASPVRLSSTKQKGCSRRASLKAFLRQSSKDGSSSGSGSRSNTPSPSPTSLSFSRQGSLDQKQQQKQQHSSSREASPSPAADGVDRSKLNGLPLVNGKAGKTAAPGIQTVPSPARVLRYNTTDGCILFEERDGGEIV